MVLRKLFLFILSFGVCITYALPNLLNQPEPTGKSEERIILKHTDNLRFSDQEMNGAKRLDGNVILAHAGMTMYCDSAVLYEEIQTFDAFGNVSIIQGDTLSLTGDRLHYDGVTQIAEMRSNVVMKHREQILQTDSLNYDRLYNVGYYFDGGNLIDGNTELNSDWGEYHTDGKNATFNYNVELLTDKFRLLTDTLNYDTQTKWAEVVGASNIYSSSDTIYTERGFYNSEQDSIKLYTNTKAFGRNRVMEGDTVYYDKSKGIMEAFSNVKCTDIKNKNILSGDYVRYNELTGEALATRRALARDYSQGFDTLYVHADTLRMFTYNIDTDSVYREMHAYFHVRAYRQDVQAVADSIVMSSSTHIMTMYRDPIAWSGEKQIVGEEINIFFNDSTIDSVYVERQALVVEKLDSIHYNQISAQQLCAYFENGNIVENKAEGNVMVVNYPLEKDSTIVYQNYLETSVARMFMKNRQLHKIWAPSSHGAFYPLGLAPEERTRLKGFAWFDYIRPLSPDDVFVWRGKEKGNMLKPSVRREAPLQDI